MVVDGGGGWLAERERESFTPVLERERQRRKKTGERELKPGKMKKICSKFSKQNKVTLQL